MVSEAPVRAEKHYRQPPSDSCTGGTSAEQKYFMIFDDKAIRCSIVHLQGTSGQFIRTVTFTAKEMMMMVLSGTFIERPERWMKNFLQPPVISQDFQGSVNRGNVERRDGLTAVGKDFFHRQWSLMAGESALDGFSLCCYSFQVNPPAD